jgi:hypothetical protein
MVYSTRPGLIIGFHGCDQHIKDALIGKGLRMNPSVKSHDWLGNGCYFWENNYERALDFAQNPPGRKIIKHPAVVGAVIELQFCLDLLDTAYLNMVKDSYTRFVTAARKLKTDLPVNKTTGQSKDLLIRNLDCSVIENVHYERTQEKLKPFDSVRGVFVEGEELYPGAGFNAKNHIQLCVRNPNCIKGFFDPLNEVQWPQVEQSYIQASQN